MVVVFLLVIRLTHITNIEVFYPVLIDSCWFKRNSLFKGKKWPLCAFICLLHSICFSPIGFRCCVLSPSSDLYTISCSGLCFNSFYWAFFTENQPTFEEETDSENKLHTILEKTRTLQDTIKNVTSDDLDNSLDDLESPGHSVEDLSDVMSERDGNVDHVEEMEQEIYGRFYRMMLSV